MIQKGNPHLDRSRHRQLVTASTQLGQPELQLQEIFSRVVSVRLPATAVEVSTND